MERSGCRIVELQMKIENELEMYYESRYSPKCNSESSGNLHERAGLDEFLGSLPCSHSEGQAAAMESFRDE